MENTRESTWAFAARRTELQLLPWHFIIWENFQISSSLFYTQSTFTYRELDVVSFLLIKVAFLSMCQCPVRFVNMRQDTPAWYFLNLKVRKSSNIYCSNPGNTISSGKNISWQPLVDPVRLCSAHLPRTLGRISSLQSSEVDSCQRIAWMQLEQLAGFLSW